MEEMVLMLVMVIEVVIMLNMLVMMMMLMLMLAMVDGGCGDANGPPGGSVDAGAHLNRAMILSAR